MSTDTVGRDVVRLQLIASVSMLAQQASYNGDNLLSRLLMRAIECAAVEASGSAAPTATTEWLRAANRQINRGA